MQISASGHLQLIDDDGDTVLSGLEGASIGVCGSAWLVQWSRKQHLSGRRARADYANPELMNRFTWYDAHHWDLPYPGDPKIYLPSEVPGAALPGSDVD